MGPDVVHSGGGTQVRNHAMLQKRRDLKLKAHDVFRSEATEVVMSATEL